VEVESSARFRFCAVAINNRGGDNIGVVGVCALDGDGFAEEVDVSVAGAGVYAGGNDDNVAVIRIVDSSLDCVKIGGAIVIYGDCSCLAGDS